MTVIEEIRTELYWIERGLARNDIETVADSLESIEQLIPVLKEAVKNSLYEKIKDIVNVHREDVCIPFMWSCEASSNPLETCVYDKQNDPCMDSCLFCEKPYERK